MIYFSSLKTSERISLSFAFFGFLSLLLFLILVNITYFVIWYNDQKQLSFSDMNQNYLRYQQSSASQKDIEDFQSYLLLQNTIIIPEQGELICSPGVEAKIKQAPEEILNSYFYRAEDKIYFIYSQEFESIGDVKVLFDTTSYITSQMTIIKVSFVFIFIIFFLQFFAGRRLTRWLLRDLKNISEKVKDVDINSREKNIICECMPDDDEIKILAHALNTSYETIDAQTSQLKQFITDVSHEFKTPLMGLSSRLDLIEKKIDAGVFSSDDMQKHISDTRANILRLNTLLESLFFLSRIESESSCLVLQDILVKQYVENKIQLISQSFPEKNIYYEIDMRSDLIIQAEQSTFSILIDNLLTNAVKFSPRDVRIIIKADEMSFSIQDNGPGISEDEIEKIWKKFYRKDTNKEGFGVGLYLVARIVKLHNWSISLEPGEKSGARFKVELSS